MQWKQMFSEIKCWQCMLGAGYPTILNAHQVHFVLQWAKNWYIQTCYLLSYQVYIQLFCLVVTKAHSLCNQVMVKVVSYLYYIAIELALRTNGTLVDFTFKSVSWEQPVLRNKDSLLMNNNRWC